MPLRLAGDTVATWQVKKITLLGPGIVGMPMAALIAAAKPRIGQTDPARVLVVQRESPTSGWKVDAINEGRSVIGGVEPGLDDVVRKAVAEGVLAATHDIAETADADIVLVCIQTDKQGTGPDYGPLFQGLDGLARALQGRPAGNLPLVIIDSTLAPSSMATVVRERFAACGLAEGRDVLLANSPNRVMPGRLVQRIRESDKLVAGLHPATPELVAQLYAHIVVKGRLLTTNSLTAEIVKTFENAYRDVRIAFAAELVRHCDAADIDFFALRDAVNRELEQADSASDDAAVVPTGGVLVPTIGVGGHCLPKDGVLLWWRFRDLGGDTDASLILAAREINDESPAVTADRLAEIYGAVACGKVALLGVAYRGDSEDTRNSPTLALAAVLRERGARVVLHDPYVRPADQNLVRSGFQENFTDDLTATLLDAELVVFCTPHQVYGRDIGAIGAAAAQAVGFFDGCNQVPPDRRHELNLPYAGLGRGCKKPATELVNEVANAFRRLEIGVANEMLYLTEALNTAYAEGEFNRVDFEKMRALAATCTTGCVLVDPASTAPRRPEHPQFDSHLVQRASHWMPNS